MAAELSKSRIRGIAIAAAGLVLIVFVAVAVAHTELGRPLLSLFPGGASCPVSAEPLPELVEAYRTRQIARRQGSRVPLGRPALRFELGKTTRAEVLAWAEPRGSCQLMRAGRVARCSSIAPTESGELVIGDLYSQFDGAGRLVALDLFREASDRDRALRALERTERRLNGAVGPSTARSGAAADALLYPMSRVSTEYRYAGYVARLSATHLGKLGVRVREQYQWTSDG